MKRTMLLLAGVFFLSSVTALLAQQAQPIPAATESEINCTGFITANPLSQDIVVFNGPDNDFEEPSRLYTTGDYVFLRARGENIAVGNEYSVVRNGRLTFEETWYGMQHAAMRALGHTYDDVGRVKVTKLTPLGAVAQVTFSCTPLSPGDIAVPYQPRSIPEYTPSADFDPFALPNGKMLGIITAARRNDGNFGTGSIVYINRGQVDGVHPGARFRIFRWVRDYLNPVLRQPATPRESLGELIVLSTQEKSSVGIIVRSLREISPRDGIELE